MTKAITRRGFLKSSLAATGGVLLKGCSTSRDLDIVIKGGHIYDGLGGEAVEADIGIKADLIREIGKIAASRGKNVIRARNLAVCPGFIDAHDHTGVEILANPRAESSIRQGITTLVSGNCGISPFPVAEETYEEEKANLKEIYQISLTWRDINSFFSRIEDQGTALNYSSLVGHGAIRGAAMGLNNRPPDAEEMAKMKAMVAENMEGGALGLSTGLVYVPGSFAESDEIVELCKVASYYGGVYATHMRDEGDRVIESLDETIDVARKTGISVQIAHLKVAGERNWGKIDAALAKIEAAAEEGISIFCDRYPYIAGSSYLSYVFPSWAKEGTTEEILARLKDPNMESRLLADLSEQEEFFGSWDKVVISSVVTAGNKRFEGKSVLQGAEETGKSPFEFMRDIMIEEKNRIMVVLFMMNEENLKRILAHPFVGVGTDGRALAPYGVLSQGKPHPRRYGTFPRVLGKYVREEKIVPMPEMVKKMTSMPAQKFGFTGRGVLTTNTYADIVIFDEDRVTDVATWTDPHRYPEGIEIVIVNGKIVIERGKHTGNLPGRVLRGQA